MERRNFRTSNNTAQTTKEKREKEKMSRLAWISSRIFLPLSSVSSRPSSHPLLPIDNSVDLEEDEKRETGEKDGEIAEMKPLSTCRTRLCPYLTRLYLIYNFLSFFLFSFSFLFLSLQQQQQQQKTLNGTANGQKSTNVLAIQQQQGCVCIPLSWVRSYTYKFRDDVEFLNQIVQHFL